MNRASGTVSARPRARRPRSSNRLNREVNAALVDPKMKTRLADVAARCCLARRPILQSSSSVKSRVGRVVKFAGSGRSESFEKKPPTSS